jgi:hypothetical protein
VFDPAVFQAAHDRQAEATGRMVTIQVAIAGGFREYPGVLAKFQSLNERDLVAGTTLRQGDVKMVISSTHWPADVPVRLELKDRIKFDGRSHAVIHCDPYARMIGEHRIATEVMVRG